MNLLKYNKLMKQYDALSLQVDEANEVAKITDDYDYYESLEKDLFELELTIPRIKPLN